MIRLVIIAGQSNAYAGGSDAADVNYGLVEAAFPDVRLLYRLGSSFASPTWIEGDMDLQPQQADDSFGVELTLGRALSDYYGPGNVVIGKFACNGTGLADHWLKTADPLSGETDNLFTLAVDKIAEWETLAGATFTDLVWIQGNKDSDDQADAEAYSANLQQFISDLRTDTGRSFRLVFDQLPSWVTSTYTDEVRSQQAAAEPLISNCRMVLTEGLDNRDGDHYTSAAYLQLGRRFFDALLEANVTALSDFLEEELFDHVFRGAAYTPPTEWWVQLHTGVPGEDGTGNVMSVAGVGRGEVTFSASASRRILSDSAAVFGTPSEAPTAATHVTVWDAETLGNCLALGELRRSFTGTNGTEMSMPAGGLAISWDRFASSPLSDVSDYLIHSILDLVFRGTAFSSPTGLKLHAYAGSPGTDDSGTEVAGTGYAAVDIAFAAASDGQGDTSAACELGPNTHASASWTEGTHVAVKDGSDNLLVFGEVTPFTVAAGQSHLWSAAEIAAVFA